MKLSPQQRTVLRALENAGRAGCHSHDLRITLHVADPSRRIDDLRELGYDIASKFERRGRAHGARYTLLRKPVAVAGSSPASDRGGVPDLPPAPQTTVGAGARTPLATPGARSSRIPVENVASPIAPGHARILCFTQPDYAKVWDELRPNATEGVQLVDDFLRQPELEAA